MQQAISHRAAPPIVHINTFGAFIRYLREREQIPQGELAKSLPYFFEEMLWSSSYAQLIFQKILSQRL